MNVNIILFLSRGYIVQFTPHLLHISCAGYTLMDKKLLHISLTKFNKLNLKRSLKTNRKEKLDFWFQNYFCKAFALYIAFIFSTFSVYLWQIVWSTPVLSYNFFYSKLKQCIVNSLCWGAKSSVLLYDYIDF